MDSPRQEIHDNQGYEGECSSLLPPLASVAHSLTHSHLPFHASSDNACIISLERLSSPAVAACLLEPRTRACDRRPP